MKARRAAFLGHFVPLALILVTTSSASGAPRRRHFEPDDLELEQPGILDLDLQVGAVLGSSDLGNHLLIPDFEIGLGLARNVELDVSGTFMLERENGRRHVTGNALWIASKLGLLETRDQRGNAWALGLELGPRLPTFDAAGIGYGVLGLLGFTRRGLGLVLNVGSLIDPGARLSDPRPSSLVFGLDFNAELDQRGRWSLQSELGATHYLSSDPDEAAAAVGATYAVSRRLDVSLTALGGFLRHTDHAGLLLGVSPQLGLW
ncbi:MAG TPA: hypothetical protein VER04_16660 [Polyangiaceae bacterium]|nr:hypothetical protein [Polyangiaceae bacterium]